MAQDTKNHLIAVIGVILAVATSLVTISLVFGQSTAKIQALEEENREIKAVLGENSRLYQDIIQRLSRIEGFLREKDK